MLYGYLSYRHTKYTAKGRKASRALHNQELRKFIGNPATEYNTGQEFYQVAFRRKLYHSLEELQVDLDIG